MGKMLVIVGTTATGKTSLGIKLAGKFSGEIVSADSRQAYKYLDIGTGKDLPPSSSLKSQSSRLGFGNKNYTLGYYNIDGVRVWLYDVIEPDRRFSAVAYAKLARRVIEDIWEKDKLPILVGGTGFYIKAVVEGIQTGGVSADWKLRETLQKLSRSELQAKLKILNKARWKKMNKSDRQNPRRLIRAIEIAQTSQKTKGRMRKRNLELQTSDILTIGLKTDNRVLYARIDRRVDKRAAEGIVEEIQMLLRNGYSWDDPGFDTLGYKEWRPFFEKEAEFDAVVKRWKLDEHAYARRQLTWFKKNKKITWYDITKCDFKTRVEEKVKKWYHSNESTNPY